jgi:hypothetical protein
MLRLGLLDGERRHAGRRRRGVTDDSQVVDPWWREVWPAGQRPSRPRDQAAFVRDRYGLGPSSGADGRKHARQERLVFVRADAESSGHVSGPVAAGQQLECLSFPGVI